MKAVEVVIHARWTQNAQLHNFAAMKIFLAGQWQELKASVARSRRLIAIIRPQMLRWMSARRLSDLFAAAQELNSRANAGLRPQHKALQQPAAALNQTILRKGER